MSFRNFLATGEQSILLPLSPAAGLPEVRTAPKDLEYALHPGAADAAIGGGVRIEFDICAVRDQHIHTTFRWGRDPRICCRRWERKLLLYHRLGAVRFLDNRIVPSLDSSPCDYLHIPPAEAESCVVHPMLSGINLCFPPAEHKQGLSRPFHSHLVLHKKESAAEFSSLGRFRSQTKPRRVFSPQRKKKYKMFSAATYASLKTLLTERVPQCAPSAHIEASSAVLPLSQLPRQREQYL